MEVLIKAGANVNIEDSRNGLTPLHFAVQNSKVDIVNYLIENGANINAKTSNGQTPLHLSVAGGFYKSQNLDKTDVVKLLLEKGATINEQDNNGDTALHLCSQTGMFSN